MTYTCQSDVTTLKTPSRFFFLFLFRDCRNSTADLKKSPLIPL